MNDQSCCKYILHTLMVRMSCICWRTDKGWLFETRGAGFCGSPSSSMYIASCCAVQPTLTTPHFRTLLLEPLPDRVLPPSSLSLLLLLADPPLLAVTITGIRGLLAAKDVLHIGVLSKPPALIARSGCRVHLGLHREKLLTDLGSAADTTRGHCMGLGVEHLRCAAKSGLLLTGVPASSSTDLEVYPLEDFTTLLLVSNTPILHYKLR